MTLWYTTTKIGYATWPPSPIGVAISSSAFTLVPWCIWCTHSISFINKNCYIDWFTVFSSHKISAGLFHIHEYSYHLFCLGLYFVTYKCIKSRKIIMTKLKTNRRHLTYDLNENQYKFSLMPMHVASIWLNAEGVRSAGSCLNGLLLLARFSYVSGWNGRNLKSRNRAMSNTISNFQDLPKRTMKVWNSKKY